MEKMDLSEALEALQGLKGIIEEVVDSVYGRIDAAIGDEGDSESEIVKAENELADLVELARELAREARKARKALRAERRAR